MLNREKIEDKIFNIISNETGIFVEALQSDDFLKEDLFIDVIWGILIDIQSTFDIDIFESEIDTNKDYQIKDLVDLVCKKVFEE